MTRLRLLGFLFAGFLAWSVSTSAIGECPCSQKARAIDPPFPAWIFGHVVWEDESTTQSVYDLVKGYQEHGIPVDGVIIDSPWETEYNTFEWDTERYPGPQKLIGDLHANDVNVIIWITSMVNFEDPAYQSCLEKGFFVKGMEEVTWWKGTGGMIDYDNPKAVEWWHRRMDKAIDMGLDGWKCDGTDPFMLMKGWNARKKYSAAYYSDFYRYTRERSGKKTIIMARPMEQLLNENVFGLPVWTNPFEVGLYLKYAPLDVSYYSWVGDQDPTFDGLKMAIRWILDSARNHYLVVGSDIGGYRAPGPEKEVLIRWAQFGSLCPMMENGGHDEHRPWAFDPETMKIYRAYTLLHKALLPYLYSEAIEAWMAGRSMMTPLARGKDHYLLGKDVLVAPIESAGGRKKVALPKGDDWWPLFADPEYLAAVEKCRVPGSAVPLLRGGCSFTHEYDLASYPVFIRAGSIVPLLAKAGPGLFGDMEGAENLSRVVLVVPPARGKTVEVSRTVYEEGKTPVICKGGIEAGSEVDHTVSCSAGDWDAIVPMPQWPVVPEEVDAISWK